MTAALSSETQRNSQLKLPASNSNSASNHHTTYNNRLLCRPKFREFCSSVAIDSPPPPHCSWYLRQWRMWEVPSSNTRRDTGYPGWGFQWFFSVPTGNVWLIPGLHHDFIFPNPFQHSNRPPWTINSHLLFSVQITFYFVQSTVRKIPGNLFWALNLCPSLTVDVSITAYHITTSVRL
jgi:hypothetical protein